MEKISREDARDILLSKNPFGRESKTKKRQELLNKSLLRCLFMAPQYMWWIKSHNRVKANMTFQKKILEGFLLIGSIPISQKLSECTYGDCDQIAEYYCLYEPGANNIFGEFMCSQHKPNLSYGIVPLNNWFLFKLASNAAIDDKNYRQKMRKLYGFHKNIGRFNEKKYLDYILDNSRMILDSKDVDSKKKEIEQLSLF